MPKTKAPDLADWQVSFLIPDYRPLKIRAVSVTTHGGYLWLTDGAGGMLFGAPQEHVYVRRLEPGQDVPEPEEAPRAEAPPDPVSPAAEKVALPRRRRGSGAHA